MLQLLEEPLAIRRLDGGGPQSGVVRHGLLQRAGLPLQRKLVENVGALDGVDEQQGHTDLLLLGLETLGIVWNTVMVRSPERLVLA